MVWDWKFNKYGNEEPDTVMCYKCQWWQPILEGGGGGAEARVDPVPEPVNAPTEGYCRKKTVPTTNINAAMVLPTFPVLASRVETNDLVMNSTESLNEVLQRRSNEFWCRYWVRTNTPFLWPPRLGS